MGREAEDVPLEVSENLVGQHIHSAVGILTCLEAKSVLTRAPFLEGCCSVNTRDSGLVAVADKEALSDGMLDGGRHMRPDCFLARFDMEEVERQAVVGGGEEVGLAQSNLLAPKGAGDAGGQAAHVARRHAEDD